MNESTLREYKNHLRTILKQNKSVIFAYLFGSTVAKARTPFSDIDIAVYLYKGVNLSEVRLDIIGELIMGLKTDNIDIVILNNAPLTLKARVIQNKEIIVDKTPFLRQAFESLVIRQYCDFAIKEKMIFDRRFFLG